MSDTTDIVEQLWRRAHNGIQPMSELARLDMLAAAAEITRLRAELAEAQQLARDDFDMRAEQRDERDRLRAALAQAGAGREPVAWQLPGSDSIIPATLKAWRGALAEQWTIPLFAHPSPAQREPLSDAQIDSAPALTLADHSALVGRRELRQFARQIEAACAAAWGVKLADSGTKETAS